MNTITEQENFSGPGIGVEPETTTPVEPVTPKIEPLPQPEPEVDVEREVEALSEQLKRIKKLMGM